MAFRVEMRNSTSREGKQDHLKHLLNTRSAFLNEKERTLHLNEAALDLLTEFALPKTKNLRDKGNHVAHSYFEKVWYESATTNPSHTFLLECIDF